MGPSRKIERHKRESARTWRERPGLEHGEWIVGGDMAGERFFPSINTGFIETESIPGRLALLIHHISNPHSPLTLPIIPPLLYCGLKPSYPGPRVASRVRAECTRADGRERVGAPLDVEGYVLPRV